MEYYLLILGLMFPLLGICVQFSQGPHNENIEKRFVVPQNSIWRKFIPFSENTAHPFIYLKIIPFLMSIVISVIVFMLYVVNLFIPDIMTPIFIHPVTITSITLLGLIYMVYAGIMNI
jgi:hypothetical protein